MSIQLCDHFWGGCGLIRLDYIQHSHISCIFDISTIIFTSKYADEVDKLENTIELQSTVNGVCFWKAVMQYNMLVLLFSGQSL